MRTIQSEMEQNNLTNTDEQVKQKKSKEQFTRREMEQLMGMHMPTFKRFKGGAMRRK